jgi:hypothetical protein
VGHERQVAPGAAHVAEQAQQVVSLGISLEAEGPVGRGLGADADARDVGELRSEQGLDVAAQLGRLHDQRVAPREQDARHLGVLAQVAHERARLVVGEAELVDADELGPAEAVGAVGVAGLSLAREEKHRLPVLVLHAAQLVPAPGGDVELHLARRVGVHAHLDLSRGGLDRLAGGVAVHELHHALEVLRIEHPGLREGELVDGVLGHVLPADQLLHHVAVHAEREDRRDRLHLGELCRAEPPQLGDAVDVGARVRAVAGQAGFGATGDDGMHGVYDCSPLTRHRGSR